MRVAPILAFVIFLSGACSGESEDSSVNAADPPKRFTEDAMPAALQSGGYIDSIFINKAANRIYFTHSILSPSVLNGSASAEQCKHTEAPPLKGQITAPGLEWNSDLYYVEWIGEKWSEPINLGERINTLGMECCIWLNDDETEIIFYTKSDLDKDGADGDLGLPATGNYRATRTDRNAQWSIPKPLPGDYGTSNQIDNERHDNHKTPSGNLYFWEQFSNKEQLLRFFL